MTGNMCYISICTAALLAGFSTLPAAEVTSVPAGISAGNEELRITTDLAVGWKFTQDDELTDATALSSPALNWESVTLPHTWNAEDAASSSATKPYKRGLGWYRLEFAAPESGARKWLEFGAASIVADVWLNGKKLGQHKGAFTAFRFDVTDLLANTGNVLLVKVDNRAPVTDHDATAIIPLAGDFNISGGLYRYVSLIATRDRVHFDLADMGGPGVYAATRSLAGRTAAVRIRARLQSYADDGGDYLVRTSLLDADGAVAQTAQTTTRLNAGTKAEVAQDLTINEAHLWQGVEDPYQYKLMVELLRRDGAPIDRVVQDFGIRLMRFDPDTGFFLNGKSLRLRGVAMHQDYLGKGWGLGKAEIDESLALVKEIGANTIRLGHYPFSRYALESVSRLGLIAWAEAPFGIGSTVQPPLALGAAAAPCPTREPSPEFVANAIQQLREMIRQQYNHAAIAMWSIGNETTFMHRDCEDPWYDNVTPTLRVLHNVAKTEDPSRVTALADFTEKEAPPVAGSYIQVGGITNIWAINQYYLWYAGAVDGLGRRLDALHARYPAQSLGMSEYGAGAALTHHTDNVRGGPAEVINTGVPKVYQPEEYASYVHEQNYAMVVSKPYVWGSYVWAMFDFATGLRNEGDLRGVNTKGLVSFDRKVRKDAFYFYKANWSSESVTYVTGRRYINRAYAVTDVKVYSNADSVRLSVNGAVIGSMATDQCLLKVCVFKRVKLSPGSNRVVASGDHAGRWVSDVVEWLLETNDINIAAGQLTTGFTSAAGERFGSDNFFIGGSGDWLVEKGTRGVRDATAVTITPGALANSMAVTGATQANSASDPRDADLFKNFRRGTFSYFLPLSDGNYRLTLGFVEPDRHTQAGHRVFNVAANGVNLLENFDVLQAAGAYRTVVTRVFTVPISRGHLKLDFVPLRGEAVVSNIMIRKE